MPCKTAYSVNWIGLDSIMSFNGIQEEDPLFHSTQMSHPFVVITLRRVPVLAVNRPSALDIALLLHIWSVIQDNVKS